MRLQPLMDGVRGASGSAAELLAAYWREAAYCGMDPYQNERARPPTGGRCRSSFGGQCLCHSTVTIVPLK